MEFQFKTASFGGYDKKAVEAYIEDLQKSNEAEVADLKANIVKLSETVKNLHTMREVNLNESKNTIDNLKNINNSLENEVNQMKLDLELFKKKEIESASRYESISRTLLEARESADALYNQTENECNEKVERVNAECEDKINYTTEECNQMMSDTKAECDQMMYETKSECERLHTETVDFCENLEAKTKEEASRLSEETRYNCKVMTEETIEECENMRNQARIDAYNTRMNVKRECESVSNFMAGLMEAVEEVVESCDNAKKVADQAFPELGA